MTENDISEIVIGTAIELHKSVGPGLLESAYVHALVHDLRKIGLNVQHQVGLPFHYKDVYLEIGYRVDIIVNQKVILEIKSLESLAPVHYAQTLTYLRLSGLKLALLINFNTKLLKDEIHRIVNNL